MVRLILYCQSKYTYIHLIIKDHFKPDCMKIFYVSRRCIMLLALLSCALSVSAQQFQAEIRSYLQTAKTKWNLSDQDIQNWTISDQYTNPETGITHTYLHQQVSGIRIFNAVSSMAIRNGEIVYFANRFYPNAAARANATSPALAAEDAIQAAAAQLGVALLSAPQMQTKNEDRHVWTFNDCGISRKPIQAELIYVPVENAFRLAWNVNIALRGSANWWNVRIDALTGAFISQNNWTVSCDFNKNNLRNEFPVDSRVPDMINGEWQPDEMNVAGYNVFPLPIEAPSFGPRSLLIDPNSPDASPYGWQDTDGASGPEFTITRGNNVYAYEDRNNADVPGYSPDGGPGLNFDFPLDLGLQPIDNQDAIITNLFYVNNTLHDVLFKHGFDEVSGNYQATNYSAQGTADDYVLAEAQDGGGTNNANFSAPPDGGSGVMQMYLWTGGGGSSTMTVHTPTGIAGEYTVAGAGFGPGITTPITSDIVLVDDGTAPTSDACESIVNGSDFIGKIAVIDRGTCTFVSKVDAAEAEGAIAVIVINNVAGAPFSMGGTGTANIPSVMISQADGDLLKAQLSAGQTVNVTLNASPAAVDLDGSIDNGIVSHEFGHGVSIRLTGGPSNSDCLNNGEQGGEGWSDWLALILTIEPADAGTNSRGIGTYALSQPVTGAGIRRYPYSTDMSINPQTYGDLASSAEVHDIGEIWAQVLWDMTWKIIDAEGFDPDWYNGTGGNNTAMKLVLEAMKLQPCGPGYLDARDAILAADEVLYNNAHRCLIWEAFAGRGMGANADQGSPDVAGDETPDFTIPTFCQIPVLPPTAVSTVDVTSSCTGTFHFTDMSTDIPQQWNWDFGDNSSSTQINPSHTYNVAGTYTVILTVTNTLGADSDTLTVTYAPLDVPVIAGDTAICAGNSTTLTAFVTTGNTAIWSLGTEVVNTGAVFNTPNLTGNTTYTVRQAEDLPVQHVGPVDNTFGTGGNHNTGFEGRLLFTALAPFRLLSVQVYAQGAADRTFTLYNASNTAIQTVTVNVPNGSSRVTLNMDIPSTGNYSIGNVSENLYRNNGGASYPYQIDNLVSIYSSNATGSALTYYYYFYDWEVQAIPCTSPPVAVAVSVTPGPVAGFNAVPNGLDVTFFETSTGNPTNWSWDFGDNTAVSTEQNPSHTYDADGTYTVTLTVGDGACSSTVEQTVTVEGGSSGTSGVDRVFGMNIFPNPTANQLSIEFAKALSGAISLQLTDVDGRLLVSDTYEQPGQRILLNTSKLVDGVYYLRITGKEGSVLRKVIVVK